MKLTKHELDIILNMLDDIESMWGLNPEELELKEDIERWFENGQTE